MISMGHSFYSKPETLISASETVTPRRALEMLNFLNHLNDVARTASSTLFDSRVLTSQHALFAVEVFPFHENSLVALAAYCDSLTCSKGVRMGTVFPSHY